MSMGTRLTSSMQVSALDDIIVLSLGSGACNENMQRYGLDADLGDYQWLRPSLNMLVRSFALLTKKRSAVFLRRGN